MKEIQNIISDMDPEEALIGITSVITRLFAEVSDDVRLRFVAGLVGDTGSDKINSLVQL